MTHKITYLFFCLFFSLSSFAQQDKMTREDKDEKNQARLTRIKDKNDYAIFHRQLLGLKEYLDERKKIPALTKANKSPVKVVAGVDTTDDGVDEAAAKILIGFIRQDIGDNSVTLYDVTFSRTTKKIVSVKRTAEAMEADNDAEATPGKKAPVKTAVNKKNKEDDDDDDTDDKPVKKKKSKDDDD
jgi:hypothetical protein